MPGTIDDLPRRFIVTSRGVTATRWLSFVLASHPRVFVSHGHFPLDSVKGGSFQRERTGDDSGSLIAGGSMREFYRTHGVAEVFEAYKSFQEDAQAYGNVHTYTLSEALRLSHANGDPPIAIANVVRHPVTYIDSHSSLVRKAEAYPEVYDAYSADMFPRALDRFRELFLVDCPDYKEFLAFVVSCFSAIDIAEDLGHTEQIHYRMESLTTDVEELKEFCQAVTGLAYAREDIAGFLDQGAINRHRHSGGSKDPRAIYQGWAEWKKDVAGLMIGETVLLRFQGTGYDVEMLREETVSRNARDTSAPSLADSLQGMDLDHPLLSMLSETDGAAGPGTGGPQMVEESYHGFNLITYGKKVYGVSQTLGSVDVTLGDELRDRYGADQVVIADSVDAARSAIEVAVLSQRINQLESALRPLIGLPGRTELIESYEGYNLVAHGGQVYAVRQDLGEIDFSVGAAGLIDLYGGNGQVLIANGADAARARVEAIRSAERAAKLENEMAQWEQRVTELEEELHALSSGARLEAETALEQRRAGLGGRIQRLISGKPPA